MKAVPFFPLPQVVMMPGIVRPFHFFEPRYVSMMDDVMSPSSEHIFAMSLLLPEDELDYHCSPKFKTVGCVVTVLQHRKNPDHTHDAIVIGSERVSCEEVQSEGQQLFRQVETTAMPYTPLRESFEDELHQLRPRLESKLKRPEAVEQWFDNLAKGAFTHHEVINLLTQMMSPPADVAQQFLEADDQNQQWESIKKWLY
jgi:Lon protease-like protein